VSGPRQRESRPAGNGTALDYQTPGRSSESIILRDALAGLADAMGWYESGVVAGIAMGRKGLEDEWRGRQEVSAAIARQIATSGPYADLADKRGQHDRAERQRAILRARGVSA
jgi:hypothetical protein